MIWWVMCEVCGDVDAPMENAEEIPFLRENLVLKGPFSQDSNVGWKKIKEGIPTRPSGQNLGLMQLTGTCASLDNSTSVWC